MSVIVKGMTIDKKDAQSCICTINMLRNLAYNTTGVLDWIDHENCDKIIEMLETLIELPPHGRLIDLDKFKSDYGMNDECAKCDKELRGSVRECETNFSYRKMDFCGWLDDAEVVIEAEGET